MAVLTYANTLAYRIAGIAPVECRVNLIGFSRTALLERIKSLALDPAKQRELLLSFAEKRIIKRGRVENLTCLADLKEEDLSLTITSQRLEKAIAQFNQFSNVSLAAAEVSPLATAVWGETLTNTLWDIRDALSALVEVMASQNRFMARITGRGQAHVFNRSRNVQMIRLLYIIATNFAGLEEAQNIDQHWYDREVGGMPRDVRLVFQQFLSTEGDFIGEVRSSWQELTDLMRTDGWLGTRHALAPGEGAFQHALADLLCNMEADRLWQEQSTPPAEEIKNRQRQRATELLSLLERFGNLGGMQGRGAQQMRDAVASIRTIVTTSVDVLGSADGSVARENALGQLTSAVANAVWDTKKTIDMQPKKHWLLKVACIAAMLLTAAYLAFRITTTALMVTGLMDPAFFDGPYSQGIMGMLLSGEIFFDALSLIYMGNVVQAINQTKGSDGDSWVPRVRKGLPRNIKERQRMMHLMVLVNEPGIAIAPAIASHIKSAMWYGNADMVLADNSNFLYNLLGGEASVRVGRKMVARMLILKEFVKDTIVAREGEQEAELTAHFLSVILGSEYTEADDKECQYFTFKRTQEIMRQFRVPAKHVEIIGREIGRRMMLANEGVTSDTNRFLVNPLSLKDLIQMLTKRGVPMEKALVMAQMLKKELDGIVRRSRLAKTANMILQKGERPNQEVLDAFVLAMREESGLTEGEAQALLTHLLTHGRAICDAAASVVGERDFTANQATREAYNTVYRVAEEIMRQDKRVNNIGEGLADRVCQIIQRTLFMETRPITSRIPLVSRIRGFKLRTSVLAKSQLAAREIAKHINDHLPAVSEIRAVLMQENPGLSFEEADQQAWAQRQAQLVEIVEQQVCGKGNRYGFSEQEARSIAEGIIAEFETNRGVRRQTAHEFAHKVFDAAQALDKTPEQVAVDLVGGERGIMLELLLDDMNRLGFWRDMTLPPNLKVDGTASGNVGSEHPLRPKLKQVLLKYNPVTQKEELKAALKREFGFSDRQATFLVTAYEERHQSIIVQLATAVTQIRSCSADIRLVAPSGAGISVNEGLVSFGSVTVNLTGAGGVKAQAEQRVRMANVGYKWGAKGGTINYILLGDSITQNVGEITRWVLRRLVSERFVARPRVLSAKQAGNLGEARIAQLNEFLAKVRQVDVPPEVITTLDKDVSGNNRYLIPPTCDPRFTDQDFIASYIVSRLTSTGAFRFTPNPADVPLPPTRAEIAEELFDIWGINGMSTENRQRYGVTEETMQELRDKVMYVTHDLQLRLGLAAFVNALKARPGGDAETEARAIGARAGMDEQTIKALVKRAKELKTFYDRGWIAISGSGENCFIQATPRVTRKAEVDEILVGHYNRTLEEYLDLTERHFSSVDEETRGATAVDRLKKLVLDAKPEGAHPWKSEIATITTTEQFMAKALELTISGKGKEAGRKELIKLLGIRKENLSPQMEADIEVAVDAAMQETMRRFGVFFEPLMDSLIGGFVEAPTQDFSPRLTAAVEGAGFLSAEEKKVFGAQAVAFVAMLQDLRVKAHDEQAVSYREVSLTGGRRTLAVACNNDVATVAERVEAGKEIMQLQHYMVAVAPASGAQTAEDIIIRSAIPLVDINRESFGLEIRQVGAFVDLHLAEVQAEIAAKARELEVAGLTEEEQLRQLTEFATQKFAEVADKSGTRPGKENYFAATFVDAQGNTVPLKADSSTLDYAGYHVDDADYRVNLTCLTDLAEYTAEHPGYVHFGNRQFGRNYRDNPLANGFQSGGNAFWGWTNEANSLKGLTPSWGAQMIYSGRVYRAGAHFIWEDYHKGTIKDKFLFADWWKLQEKDIGLRILGLRPWAAFPASVAFQVANLLFAKPAAWLLDIVMVVGPHTVKDIMHARAIKGKMWFALRKRIDAEKIINKKVNTMLAAQDATTESEDIASDIWFLRRAFFFADETRSKWDSPAEFVRWFRAQFAVTGTYYVPRGMFASAFVPGIAGLGAHSDDKRGKDVTFDGRWLRGNLALIFAIMDTPMGFWRKLNFLSLSAFWGKGLIRPALLLSPLAFLAFGMTPIQLPGQKEPMLAFFTLSFASFAMNFGVFMASMSAKGYFNLDAPQEGTGCLMMDHTGTETQIKAAWQGFMLRGRPPFVASPKEAIAPAKAPFGGLAADYAFAAANIWGMYAATQYMLNGGSGLTSTLIFWCGWSAIHELIALWQFNKGILISSPAAGAQPATVGEFVTRTVPEWFLKYYPRYKTNGGAMLDPLAYASEEGGRTLAMSRVD